MTLRMALRVALTESDAVISIDTVQAVVSPLWHWK